MRILSLALASLLLSGCAGLPQSDLLALQNAANQDYANGRFVEAGEQYRRLAKAMPADAGVRYQLGNSLARQGDVQGAINSYREALLRDRQHARAWHNLLQLQLREALFTATEMQSTLNPQQPQADRALALGKRLLDVMEQPGRDAEQEP
ncbi:tetratricopeptide repeat protein [Pseudomonas anguilliseptica]|uniref:tetratricopeptide repeat protein n=1 Tax=Pseudomonas anguilliseptica TaxID=53406 RepID=UPI001F2EFBA8|nr:tetratricopeptide repeat protein [Pseudomonas anguilliseptica]MCE5361824.1 tetratricopeptide repeat protein [Pseudomonas anguilliseptica]